MGEKTAISLLQQYENIDRIYKNLEELTPKLKNSFEENKEILFISKELATIKTDLDLELPTVKTSETAYLSDQVLLEAQEKVLNLELNKYTISQDENIEVENENDSKEDISENKNIEGKAYLLNFEEEIYFIQKDSFGKYIGKISDLKKLVFLNSQSILEIIDEKINFEKADAYDCILFLKDPSIRPDNPVSYTHLRAHET